MNNENYLKYLTQREWSDKTIPQAIGILANHFDIDLAGEQWNIEETSVYEDTKLCGDLKLYNNSIAVMIGYRCRKEKYLLQYPYDVTFRYKNKQDHITEFAKLMEGKGDFNLYAFHLNGTIVRWILMNMHAFRKAHSVDLYTEQWVPVGNIKRSLQSNVGYEDTDFMAYNMLSILDYDTKIKLISPNDNIIMDHSPGYFKDLRMLGEFTATLKQKHQRLDRG